VHGEAGVEGQQRVLEYAKLADAVVCQTLSRVCCPTDALRCVED